MRTIIIFALLVGVAGAGEKSLQELYPAGVYPTGSALPPREPRLLFFLADWCQPCHVAIDQEVIPGTQRKGGFRAWLKNWTIDSTERAHIQLVDFDKNPELAALYKVTQLPSVVLIDGEHHDAVPYVNMQTMVRLLEKPKAAASVLPPDDLRRIGCKLRPDLGSGVNTDRGVVTCWHCVASGKPIIVECDGETARGTVIAFDAAADVAVLSVPWKQPHPTVAINPGSTSSDLQCIARTREGPLGIELYSIVPPQLSLESGMVWLNKPFISSQSGGALVDNQGRLAGIVSGNSIEQEPFHGLMIPAVTINRILRRP